MIVPASTKVAAALHADRGGVGSPVGVIVKLPVMPSSIFVLKSSEMVPARVLPA